MDTTALPAPAPSTSQQLSVVQLQASHPPLLCLSTLGHHFAGLVDTGASHSLIGKMGIGILRNCDNIKTKPSNLNLRFGGGDSSDIQEEVELEIIWHNGQMKRVFNFLLVPSYPFAFILGRNFIVESEIVMSLRTGLWWFGSDPFKRFQFNKVCRHLNVKRIGTPDEQIAGKSAAAQKPCTRIANINIGSQEMEVAVAPKKSRWD